MLNWPNNSVRAYGSDGNKTTIVIKAVFVKRKVQPSSISCINITQSVTYVVELVNSDPNLPCSFKYQCRSFECQHPPSHHLWGWKPVVRSPSANMGMGRFVAFWAYTRHFIYLPRRARGTLICYRTGHLIPIWRRCRSTSCCVSSRTGWRFCKWQQSSWLLLPARKWLYTWRAQSLACIIWLLKKRFRTLPVAWMSILMNSIEAELWLRPPSLASFL